MNQKNTFENIESLKVRRASSDEWGKFKNVRIRATLDSAYAFGDTLEETEARYEETWRQWMTDPYVFVAEDKERFIPRKYLVA